MDYFDSLGFAQALRKVAFSPEQAETFASLVRDHVVGNTVRKDDLMEAESRLNDKIDRVQERITSELKQLEQRMTIRLGTMIAGAVAIIVAVQKLFLAP